MMKRLLMMSFVGLFMFSTAQAQRVADKLSRGLVAIPQGDKTGQDSRYGTTGTGNFVSWRKLATDYYDTKYNLYRNGTKVNSAPLSVTNYQDNNGNASSKYKVVPVVKGQEVSLQASAEVTPWPHQYWDIPVKEVVGRDGNVSSGYTLNDCSVADVDGDGQMEFVVKRRNDTGSLNTTANTTHFNLHECYKMDGTRLWWIDMGPNLMAGPDEQFDLILYDWDGDGKAEALMRGADNMIIHTKSGKAINIGNMNYFAPRDEYTREGNEYLLYINGETGEPYGWDGSDNWTPQAYPLPRYEQGESDYATVWGKNDTGHRATKHYFGAPYLDGRKPSIFLGRGCYSRHKFCALDVDPATHQLTQRWRWNCYDGSSPWFGNGFHNFAIADVDLDGRDEIVFGSMMIDDTGYGLSTTGFGHGDAQHCGDLDPYRWGMEQFVCLESAYVPGIAYTDATTSTLRFSTGSGADQGRCMAGNFLNSYPGAVGLTYGMDAISLTADRVITGVNMANDDYLNMRVYWDGDLLDEFMDSPGVERSPCVYKAPGQKEVHSGRSYDGSRCWMGEGNLNNSSKNNPGFLGDIIGDWREEIVVRAGDRLRIYTTSYESPWAITTLWADHEYRNAMTWQSVGYNQPPHPSFFLGELEGITKEPPAVVLEGRTEVSNGGTITTTDDHLLVSGYEDHTITVQDGAAPWVLTVNAPAWVKGSGSRQATSSTPKLPKQTVESFTTTFTGGAFGGATRLVKQGEGTMVLPNVVERHTGNTDVWNGTLQFDGTMESSPVWLNRHTTLISNGGKFLGGLKAEYNATIFVGGKEQTGSLTVSTLDLNFGARLVMDITESATPGSTEGIDQLAITKLVVKTTDWSYGPRYKAPVIEFKTAGTLADGIYDLGTVGSVEGDVSALNLEGLGDNVTSALSIEEGHLKLKIEVMRESDIVTWNGTQGNNVWEQAVSEVFLRQGESAYSANGDDVIFNDEAANTSVTIKGRVTPRSVTFNNETKNYTINGDSIVGGAPIVKNGKGRVTFNNWNNTGNTTINGGTVIVSMLANNTGQRFGSLGNSASAIQLNDGATLQTNGVIITDQQLNVNGSVTVNVPSGKSVIFNKGIKGTGAIVTKAGSGSMEMMTGNTFARLIAKAGTVRSNHNSSVIDQTPSVVEFQGGVLEGANREATPYLTNNSDFVVNEGREGTFYAAFGGTYTGKLTGSGTFNVYTGGIRCYFDGDWSEFEGTIHTYKQNRQNKKSYDPIWAFRNSKGLPNARLYTHKDVRVSNEGKDIELGSVFGDGTLVGSGKWILGTNNQDLMLNTEIGVTYSRQDPYGGTIAKSTSPVVKRGTGILSIMVPGNINGALTVEQGTVAFNDAALNTLLIGSNALTVQNGGCASGQGLLNTLNVMSGGQLVPSASEFGDEVPGTIKTQALLNLRAGSTATFLLSKNASSTLQAAMLYVNGTVKVKLMNGYTPQLNDEFTLWTVNSTFKYAPTFDLPALPDGLYWDTSGLNNTTGVLRITDNPEAGVGSIASKSPVDCQVYTLGGTLLGTIVTTKAEAALQARQLVQTAGTYIVKMYDGHRMETQKLVVK